MWCSVGTRHGEIDDFCNGSFLQTSVYVDNLYSVGRSAYDVTSVLEDFGRELRNAWRCDLKPSSKEFLVAKGNPNDVPVDLTWKQLGCMRALGHYLQDDGSTEACYNYTVRSLWRSFFANAGSSSARSLPLECRLRLLDRATKPKLTFTTS